MAIADFKIEGIEDQNIRLKNLQRKRLIQFTKKFRKLLVKQNNNRFYNKYFLNHKIRKKNILKILYQICKKFKYSQITFSVSVSLLDTVISQFKVSKSELNRITIVCLVISSKLHEINPLYYSNSYLQTLNLKNLDKLEYKILHLLKFKINLITPMHFVFGILELHPGYFFPSFFENLKEIKLAIYDLNLIISTGYFINEFTPISIALTLLLLVRTSLNIEWEIPEVIYQLSGITENKLELCAKKMLKLIKEFQSNEQEKNEKQIKSIQEEDRNKIEVRSFYSIDN